MGGFLGGAGGKESANAANAGDARDTALISGSGRFPGGGHGNPLQYSSWEIHGQRSLLDYSLQGHKESNIPEHTWNLGKSNLVW